MNAKETLQEELQEELLRIEKTFTFIADLL